MAVRLKKASVLLEFPFLQQCSSAGWLPFVTAPPTPLHRKPAGGRGRGQTSSPSPEQATTSKKSSSSVKKRSKYIVNPCRYPPHVLHARLSQSSRNVEKFHKLSSLHEEQHSHFRVPPLLSCVSLLCERATHLSPPLRPSLTHDQDLTAHYPTAMGLPLLDAICTFSSTSSLSSQPETPPSDDRPTPAQMALVLLKLREEMPAFFDGHHSMDLYADDVLFENCVGHKSWTVQGTSAYFALLTIWRLGVKTCFGQAQLDLLKISKDVEQGKIEARWRARGRPRAPWITKERIIVEAFSTFQVRADGNIASHKMDKVMPGGKEPNRVMSWLARVGVALIPQPSIGVTRTSHDLLPHNA